MIPKMVPVQSVMGHLAEEITANAKTVSTFLQSNGHPQPSFDRDAPAVTVPLSAPQDVLVARQELIEATFKMYKLALGPSEYLPHLAVGVSSFNFFDVTSYHSLLPFPPSRQCPLGGEYMDFASVACQRVSV